MRVLCIAAGDDGGMMKEAEWAPDRANYSTRATLVSRL